MRANSFILILVLVLITLLLPGCVKNIPEPPPPELKFLTEPDIELDPILNAPLAALLTLKTNIPVQVEIQLSTTDSSHTINVDLLKDEHYIPVLGLKPDKEYKINVLAYSDANKKNVLRKPLELTTDPLPEGFPSIKLVKRKENKLEPGYTLFDIIPEGDNGEFGALIVAVNSYGEIVWYQIGTRYTDVRQLNNGHLLFIEGAKIVQMNMLGQRIYEWQALYTPKKNRKLREVNAPTFHHEVYPLETGNLLTLSVEHRPFDNYPTDAKNPKAPKNTANVVGDLILEIRRDGAIRRKWSLLDLMDPWRLGRNSLNGYWDPFFNRETRDWTHGNAVIYSPSDNAIIVTSRHQNATIKFRRKNGELLWILGPHDGWTKKQFANKLLTPVNDQKYFFPYHSHAPEIMPNGNLLIYDNGNYRTPKTEEPVPIENNFSRAVEYAIDERNKKVELVWEYGQFAESRVYSGALGDADYLPIKNNVLITHGNVLNKSGKLSARILEVTHTTPAEEVFRLDIVDETDDPKSGWRVYRSDRIADLYGPDSGIRISQPKRLNPGPE